MKHLYKIFSLATLPLIFTACQDEIANDNSAIQDKDMYTLHCVVNNASQSRAQIQLGNTAVENEIFIWNSKDQFMVFNHSDIDESTTVENPSYNTFVIDSSYSDDNPSNSADFIGVTSLEEGQRITAIYPEQDMQNATIEKGWIRLSLASKTNNSVTPTQEGWKEYMSNNMFMYAIADVQDNSTTLQFQHLFAMARITYTNATNTEQNIREMVLKGDPEKYLFSGDINLNLKTGEKVVADLYNAVVQSYNNEEIIGVGESRDFYLIFFPGEKFGENDSICIRINAEISTPFISTKTISAANNGAEQFEAGKRYWFNVAQTEEGLVWTKDMSEELITNKKLIEILEKNHGYSFIKDENGYVNVYQNYEQINRITSINIWQEDAISTLEGIEYFPNLEGIYCDSPELSHLDVSKNLKLRELHCSGGKLNQIDVTQNTGLEYLQISNNQLTTIDISNNTELVYLILVGNRITALNLTANTELAQLSCAGNQLSELNVIANTKLHTLDCAGNFLTELNVSENPHLTQLDCCNNQLTQLDVSKNGALQELDCSLNQLTELFLEQNTALTILACYGNPHLTELNLENNTALLHLDCMYNQLTTLDLSANTALEDLRCGHQRTAEGYDQKLRITVAEEQIELWDNIWKENGSNYNVIRAGSPEENPSTGGLGNFGNGGVY